MQTHLDDTNNSIQKYFLQDPSLIEHMNQRYTKKIVLYDLPQIQQYRMLNKPFVSQEKKRMIKEKLDLEQQSLQQTKERQKRNQYFLNYYQNPFINLQPNLNKRVANIGTGINKQKNINQTQQKGKQGNTQNFQQTLPVSDEKGVQITQDIIYELNAIKQKDLKPQFIKLKDDFRIMRKNADLLSNKIIEVSSKKEDFDFFNNKKLDYNDVVKNIFEKGRQIYEVKKLQKKTGIDKKMDRNQIRNRANTISTVSGDIAQLPREELKNPILSQLPDNPMTFQEIIAVKQQNFFMKKHSKLNIFKIAFNQSNDYKDIIGKQILNKYYFNFTSMVQKLQKIKIPIYRDISRMARRISLNVSTGKQDIFDYIDSYELSFKTNALNFLDLMSVASGRFTTQFVSRATNFDVDQNIGGKQVTQTSSQQEEEQIYYEQNGRNIAVRFCNQGQQEQQIINYLKLQYNSKEVTYKQICQQFKKDIHKDLKTKEKLISTTIQDKYLHGQIDKSIKNQMKDFVNMDQNNIEVDRLVRMNKAHKNKNVSIKVQKILETFDINQKHQQVINKLGLMQEKYDTSESRRYQIKSPISSKKGQFFRCKTALNQQQNYYNNSIPQNTRTPEKPIKQTPTPTYIKKLPQTTSKLHSKYPAPRSITPTKSINNNINSRTPQKKNQFFQNNKNDNNDGRRTERKSLLTPSKGVQEKKKSNGWKF